jgi:predicted DNA-binding protein
MLSIDLDPEIERRLSELAKRAGQTEDSYARELIAEHLDEIEDLRAAEGRLGDHKPPLTGSQVRKELGLED